MIHYPARAKNLPKSPAPYNSSRLLLFNDVFCLRVYKKRCSLSSLLYAHARNFFLASRRNSIISRRASIIYTLTIKSSPRGCNSCLTRSIFSWWRRVSEIFALSLSRCTCYIDFSPRALFLFFSEPRLTLGVAHLPPLFIKIFPTRNSSARWLWLLLLLRC